VNLRLEAATRVALRKARQAQTPVFVFDLGEDVYYASVWNDRTAQLAAVAVVLPNAITLGRK
jgi:ABC-type sugar transport system substrate-binding protein